MEYETDKNKTKQITTNKKPYINEEKEIEKHTSSDEEQGEIFLSYWCSPSDFFLDLSLVLSQLQVLLSYSCKEKKKKKSHLLVSVKPEQLVL